MKIKKYVAATEPEAIEKVKEDLGMDALILNIKKIQPQGLFSFLKKSSIEVTAAYAEKPTQKPAPLPVTESKPITAAVVSPPAASEIQPPPFTANGGGMPSDYRDSGRANVELTEKEKTIQQQQTDIQSLEARLNNTEEMLENAVSQLKLRQYKIILEDSRMYENNIIQFFHTTLVDQGVQPQIAKKILEIADSIDEIDKVDINLIVKIVYNSIINILGTPEPICPDSDGNFARTIIFIGPTGVGKTTTIVKLTSNFILNEGLRVGLMTADTYRIAAVEQLRTYAEILGIDVSVIYNGEELKQREAQMSRACDLIFVDTAGRSHKNDENVVELKELLDASPNSERYLVLSNTTRFEDLLSIIETYSAITDFKMIFTKLDETSNLGSILNLCYLTGKKISYVTNGQNVPDDISMTEPEKVARALLGLGNGVF